MRPENYLSDPCRASSLPFWKAEQVVIPAHMAVIRDDVFCPGQYPGTDEPYFKLIHRLNRIHEPVLDAPFTLTPCCDEDLAAHINGCYDAESVSQEELAAYRASAVYDSALWLAVAERRSGQIVASGIAELDRRIGEGVLDWIQVSPAFRRRGLGRYIVCELLRRMQGRADFVTVSGRMNNLTNPFALYTACGFAEPVIWHVVSAQ